MSLDLTRASVSLDPIRREVAALAQQVRHRADVVLVRVREDERLDVVEPVLQVAEVGQDQVDARLVGLGEQDSAVDDEQPPWYSKTVMLRPISPSPPRATTRRPCWAGGRRGEVRMRMAHRQLR